MTRFGLRIEPITPGGCATSYATGAGTPLIIVTKLHLFISIPTNKEIISFLYHFCKVSCTGKVFQNIPQIIGNKIKTIIDIYCPTFYLVKVLKV